MNKVLGTSNCPLPWCGEPGAEVREGERGTPYVVCDACGAMIRTNTRKGKLAMRALVAAAPPAQPVPAPAAKPVDEKPAAQRRKYGFA